jgi:uncharacterized protein
MMELRKITLAALVCLGAVTGCGSDEENDPGQKTDYDRQAMLTNYSDNLIVPGYQAFQTEADQLHEAVAAFVANPATATLTAARTEYQQTAGAWQAAGSFEFGPADQQMLRNNLNIYPTTTGQIEYNISAGSYDLQAAANLSAKGLPAIDYLLYGKPSEAEVLAWFTSDAQAANRKKYLQDVTAQVKQLAQATLSGWTGGYATTFKQSPGTAVGSAVGNLVNQLNFEIDLIKRAKVGIPAGKFTAGTPLPEKAEAYYSQASLELLKKAIQAQKAVFLGQNAAGTNGPGLDDYLNHVGAQYNNQPLAKAIEQQFDAALAAANAVPVPLTEAVNSHAAGVSKVYEELQKLIVLTKTDMPAALGVTISYTDNDGD